MKYTKKTKAELRIEKAKEELELVRKAHDDLEYIYKNSSEEVKEHFSNISAVLLTYGSEQSSKAEGKKPFEFLYSPDIEEDEEDEE